MLEKKFTVKNKHGLHLRPATEFIKITACFKGEVYLAKGDVEVNAKSILGLLTLGIDYEDEVIIRCTGEGEDDFIRNLQEFFNKEE